MPTTPQLNHPWLLAVWPGMGNVALNAGVYLLAKMEMQAFGELDTGEFFDVEQVEIKGGIVQPGRRPRNRLFLWQDPGGQRDLLVLLGEAQPRMGKYAFGKQLVDHAHQLGVERVVTFAAMVTDMQLNASSRVFGAATDAPLLQELSRFELETLEDGQIGGMNGVLLGAAAESGLPGACLLGEMPHLLNRLPFPRASLAILEVFVAMTGISVDFNELSQQVEAMDRQLRELLSQMEEGYPAPFPAEEAEFRPEPVEQERLTPADRQRIEQLFDLAAHDRSKAFELKQELDGLEVFAEYEDRFLDLFKKEG